MTAIACKQFPCNTDITLCDADYLSRIIRQLGLCAALSFQKIRPNFTREEIIAFAQRNGLDAPRSAA